MHFERPGGGDDAFNTSTDLKLYFGSTPGPQDAIVANKGFKSGSSSLKMKCHPAGDWNPGWGVDPNYIFSVALISCVGGDADKISWTTKSWT